MGQMRLVRAMAWLAIVVGLFAAKAQAASIADQIAEAQASYDKQNYSDALGVFEQLLERAPDRLDPREAEHATYLNLGERVIDCHLRLDQYDEALEAALRNVERSVGTYEEARTQRLLGNLYLTLPKYGTRSGGKFHRGDYEQGVRVNSERHDKRHAARAFDRARTLYAQYATPPVGEDVMPAADRASWPIERIEMLFEFAQLCSRFGIYGDDWDAWFWWWTQRDDSEAQLAGEDEFIEVGRSWHEPRRRPIGLRTDAQGQPIFPETPEAYVPTLSDDQRVLYLLDEVRRLDPTDNRRFTARSWYVQATLARARFGVARMESFASRYQALRDEMPEVEAYELGPEESIILVEGRPMRATLPALWSPHTLLTRVANEFADSGEADKARYAMGAFFQRRAQYPQAIKAYEELEATFPESRHVESAQRRIEAIRKPEVILGGDTVQMPEKAQLALRHRNVTQLWFVVRKVDARGLMQDLRVRAIPEDGEHYGGPWGRALSRWDHMLVHGYDYYSKEEAAEKAAEVEQALAQYVGPEIARWSEPVVDDPSHRVAESTLALPEALRDQPGIYLVYAYVQEPEEGPAQIAGEDLEKLGDSRGLLVLQNMLLVRKLTHRSNLYLATDAATGEPLSDVSFEAFDSWRDDTKRWHSEVSTPKPAAGPTPIRRGNSTRFGGYRHLMATTPDGDLAWENLGYGERSGSWSNRGSTVTYLITDRPVYRPGQVVRFKAWARYKSNDVYRHPERATVRVLNPRGEVLIDKSLRVDEFGGVEGEILLDETAMLGAYTIDLRGRDKRVAFSVEEYRKPEFEVSVEPTADHARLGEPITATIEARYYFDAPVSHGEVTYRVFREAFEPSLRFNDRWNWLYGPSYGLPEYRYERRSIRRSQPASPHRELVSQHRGQLDEDGQLKVQIDTADVAAHHGDQCHRYTIEAEVRDASRRVITGSGSVEVSPQYFYATMQFDRGYYQPGEQVYLRVRLLTPDGQPVVTPGTLTIHQTTYADPARSRLQDRQLQQWQVTPLADGVVRQSFHCEANGRLRATFKATDKWGGEVEASASVWVVGKDFDGSLHTFDRLEIIPDQRTYEIGDFAHVMINVPHPDAWVLFARWVDGGTLRKYEMVRVTGHSTVIKLPIWDGHDPNFFVEATTVYDGQVLTAAAPIIVPPSRKLLNVTVKTDKAYYKPGDPVRVDVNTRDSEGRPVQAQVTLAAFDRSLLYIRPETIPPINGFFHGRLRHYYKNVGSNFKRNVTPIGSLKWTPDRSAYWPGFHQWWTSRDAWRTQGLLTLGANSNYARSYHSHGNQGGGSNIFGDTGASPSMAQQEQSAAMDGAAYDHFAQATLRSDFADTAAWKATLKTDSIGRAVYHFKMPDNLTTWKINAWAMTADTRVGQVESEAITSQELLVRLQAPRHFVERDEVVITANVHNYLLEGKNTRVRLDLEGDTLELLDAPGQAGEGGSTAYAPQQSEIMIAAEGQQQLNWRVRVRKPGEAQITITAQHDESADAMRMTFPVVVYGATRQVTRTGDVRPEQSDHTVTIDLDVPEQRKPGLSLLEVKYAPSLVGTMIDALPYLIEYPYGCAEQTTSRFLGTVYVQQTLKHLDIDLKHAHAARGRLDEPRAIHAAAVRKYWGWAQGEVYSSPELDSLAVARAVQAGVHRLKSLQRSDGGWGWFKGDEASPFMTSYTLMGLITAEEARPDLDLDRDMISRGLSQLERLVKSHQNRIDTQVLGAYVLSLRGRRVTFDVPEGDTRDPDLVERLWTNRALLTPYGQALLALTLANLGDEERGRTVYQNLMQFVEATPETQSAHIHVPNRWWWCWWNHEIETTAWALRAMARYEPRSEYGPQFVRWLTNNRRNGYYWGSTRDTSFCLAALSEYVKAAGETAPDMTVTLHLDGELKKQVHVNRENFFTYDNRFVLAGDELTTGKHTITLHKQGKGALYYTAQLRYFSQEDAIAASGHELKIERTCYRLVQVAHDVAVSDAQGDIVKEGRLRYRREPIADGDAVRSGDLIQVELKLTADNDYTYLAIEDPKPAGFEPVTLQSGMERQEGFWAYVEARDQQTTFFIEAIQQGEHLLRYRLRAEAPGVFHAMPTQAYAMYADRLRANSASQIIRVHD